MNSTTIAAYLIICHFISGLIFFVCYNFIINFCCISKSIRFLTNTPYNKYCGYKSNDYKP